MSGAPDRDGVVAGLAEIVGPGGLRLGEDMSRHVEDWWGRKRGTALAVVMPKSTAEVAAVMRLASRHRMPVYPQGGNTTTCGGAIPPMASGGIVVNLARMNRVIAIDAADNSMTVEAGVVLADAMATAADANRLFPMGLGSQGSCQIGGIISTNAGGTAVVRYGNTRDLVLGLEAVLPDGRIWNGLRSLRKNNSGYDLKHLFAGAEGTLGIITAATLKLFTKPTSAATALIGVARSDTATRIGREAIEALGAELTALEIISGTELALVERHIGLSCPLPGQDWYLLVELQGTAPAEELDERLQQFLALRIGGDDGGDAIVASSEAQRNELWRLRHSVTEANKREGMGFSFDIAVPLARIDAFLERAGAAVARAAPQANTVVVGHLGDGNLHYIPMFPHAIWRALPDGDGLRREVFRIVYDIAAELGGTFSAEHGIGDLHLAEMSRYKDPVELEIMRQVKATLDPLGIMNPGRVLP